MGDQVHKRGLLARRNQRRCAADLDAAIAVIEEKLARPVCSASRRKALYTEERERARAQGRKPRKLSFGYTSKAEHAMKRQRLEHLRVARDRVTAEIDAGVVHIVRGGKKLARRRLHLKEAGVSQAEWVAHWHAKRRCFGANGETTKRFGNETIRVSPQGVLEVDLPPALARFANMTARGVTRYRFDAKVSFSYRQAEWAAQVKENRAIAYDVVFAANGKVYLDASFTPGCRRRCRGSPRRLPTPLCGPWRST